MSRSATRIALALLCVAGLWLGARIAQARALEAREAWTNEDRFMLVLPPQAAVLTTGGYNELAADLTWTRMLVYYGSAKIGKSDFRYLELLIDNVIALDPHFYEVYEWAAGAVTFRQERATQQEFKTSVKYIRMGIEQFPESYDLQHMLAMKLWWELGSTREELRANRREAARVAERAMRLPTAPPEAATLIASMWTDLGELEHARNTLKQMLLTTDNKEARKKMIRRFAALADSPREAELLAKAKREFDKQHDEHMPLAPSDLFVIVGPKPQRKTVDELIRGTVLGRLELLVDERDEAGDVSAPDAGAPALDASATKTDSSP